MKVSKRLLQEGIVQDYAVNTVKGDFTHEVWNKKSPHFLDFKYFINDGIAESKVGLVTLTKVTHGFRPTQNNLVYMPADLKDAIPTLTSPYNIPIKPAHKTVSVAEGKKIEDREVGVVGRALSGVWVENPKAMNYLPMQMIKDGLMVKAPDVAMAPLMKKAKKSGFIYDEDFEGLGWILVKGLVTDSDAIEKTLDGRFLTVSVEMTPQDLYDSISGKSYKSEDMEWDIGDEVDGMKAYGVPSGLRYRGYAYVTHPADAHARVMGHKQVSGNELQQYLDNFKTTMVLTDCFKNITVTDITDSDMMASFDNGPVSTPLEDNGYGMGEEHPAPAGIDASPQSIYDALSDQEKAFADSIKGLFNKVGPLDKANGIWVGYEGPEDNENRGIGVCCANCALKASNANCQVLDMGIHPEGYCRFAAIPDMYIKKDAMPEEEEKMEDSINTITTEEQKMASILTDEQRQEVKALVDEYLKIKNAHEGKVELISELESLRAGKALADEALAKYEIEITALKEKIAEFVVNNFAVSDEVTADNIGEVIKTITIDDAVWSTAYVNNLPDSAFFYIETGGEKDEEGKTKPRSLRHLPYKDETGKVDLPHLRNAIARAPQVKDLAPEKVKSIQARAQKMLARMQSANKSKMDEADFADLEIEDSEIMDAEGFVPTPGMASAAKRALEWRAEFKRGGTPVGVARARDLMNRKELSPSTVMRMKSFFARHEVDKKASGFNQGEEGFPSAGRIAWDLWGGDGGKSWSYARAARIQRMRTEDETSAWVLDIFDDFYSVEDNYEEDIEDAKMIKVGDFVSYAVNKDPDPLRYAKGKVTKVDKDGKVSLDGTSESREATSEDPVATLEVYMDIEDSEDHTDAETLDDASKVKKTDRKVIKNFSELKKIMAPIVWSKKETPPLGPMRTQQDSSEEAVIEDAEGPSGSLAEKVKAHNEKYGDAEGKRVTLGMLKSVYNRGIGAYKTNPSSVRPNVASAEQWAHARVNGFLFAVRTGNYKRKPFDTDLLPKGHAKSSKK
jgi:hypothetical protein